MYERYERGSNGFNARINIRFLHRDIFPFITDKSASTFLFSVNCDLTVAKPEQKILSQEEIELLKAEVRKRMRYDKKYNGYFINGYAILISIETGMRVAELCALEWDDINFDKDFINIHSQQLYIVKKGGKEYYYVGYTKNERGIPNGGRDFRRKNL